MNGTVLSAISAELSSIPAELLSSVTEDLVGAHQLDFQPAPDSDLAPTCLEQLAPPQPKLPTVLTLTLMLFLAALVVATCLLSLQRRLRGATAGLFSPCFQMRWLFDIETGGIALVLTGLQLEPELAERLNKYCVGMQGVGVPCRVEASIDEFRVRLRLKRALFTLLRPARWLEEEGDELPELLLLSVRGLRLQHTELPVDAWAGAAVRERLAAAVREAATAELIESLATLRRLGTPVPGPTSAARPATSAASAASAASASASTAASASPTSASAPPASAASSAALTAATLATTALPAAPVAASTVSTATVASATEPASPVAASSLAASAQPTATLTATAVATTAITSTTVPATTLTATA